MFQKIFSILKMGNGLLKKEEEELDFQKGWAKEFKENKDRVLEYWKEYRYFDKIISICDINSSKKVLDVGCGISTVLHYLDAQKFGVDPLADEYKKIYDYPSDITIKKSFEEKIDYPSGYFDVIFCSNVIDHVGSMDAVINEISRMLKSGGFFVLTVETFEKKVERNAAHPHCITREDFDSLVSGNEFGKLFHEESKWISLRRYVNGDMSSENKETIIIWRKK